MHNFTWFQGVVESREDPLMLGRVKIRCLGYHTEDTNQLSTEDLPWAHPVQPITSAAMSGIGVTPLGPVEGTWVVGFFRDGEEGQLPVYFGTLGGIHTQPEKTPGVGFRDPNGNYPLSEGPNASTDTVAGNDTNSLARGMGGVAITNRVENLDSMAKQTEFLLEYEQLDEPSPRYAAQYPFNHVKSTESGHVEEFDDTPGSGRIHRYHRSGSFEEFGPDGERVLKVVNRNYEVTLGDNDVHVKGDANVQIDGRASVILNNGGDILSNEDLNLNVFGDFKLKAQGKITIAGLQTSISGQPINLNGDPDVEQIPI